MKPTLGDTALLERFAAYHKRHPAWGALHVILDDGNIRDIFVKLCRDDALKTGDVEGAALADILLTMSKSQRWKLPNKVHAISSKPPSP